MISVKDNINDVLSWTDRLSRQYEFAVASALTATVRAAAAVMPGEVQRAFEGGAVPFTRQGFYTVSARKDKLTAVVGIKRLQAEYMAYQVEGGARRPKRRALRVPADVKLTEQGNLPAGTIAQLVRRAKAGKRATPGQARRFGVSAGLDLFYGEPGDGRPAGVYKRVVSKGGGGSLIPVVIFPKVSAKYKPSFNFSAIARRKVVAAFEPQLLKAWARAKATAR